jgi:transposase
MVTKQKVACNAWNTSWLADLLAHGCVRGSFIPPESIQELRVLTRARKQLVREKASHLQRLEKTIEDANLKLSALGPAPDATRA